MLGQGRDHRFQRDAVQQVVLLVRGDEQTADERRNKRTGRYVPDTDGAPSG